ncbi:DUF1878 domain-containing protein [Fictibacillus sp. KU28468]|uniref:DUF1878 domain-containing protein n=1 Tax=Fictibacillus sp. KU28468 TaxID=2991053 RepID=UPI00223CBDB3|nr:DUF1878 domain-containing protein [Fictibacillus sp. KU28468]UZJ78755.1 DUF1878 domain-containing protein [Fictibacillus sp. KU28468]
MEKELEQRLDFIEFRQRLLFTNSEVDRVLFDHDVTREQYSRILDLFDTLRSSCDIGEKISSVHYESEIYKIVPHRNHNYHFAEEVAQSLHEEGRYEEVFEALYGHAPKFQSYLDKHNA